MGSAKGPKAGHGGGGKSPARPKMSGRAQAKMKKEAQAKRKVGTRPTPGKGKMKVTKPNMDRSIHKPEKIEKNEDGSFKKNTPKKKGKKSLFDKLKTEMGTGKPEKGTKRKMREEVEAMPLSKKKKENRHFMKRLTHDELFKLAQESKIVWEKIRVKDIDGKERAQAIEEHLEKLQGNILTFCVKHDASRVIQTCLKYGSEANRAMIYGELKDGLKDLIKSKYGRVIVKKLFMYCDKPTKAEIIETKIRGHVLELMKHKDASNIVEYAFNFVANSEQKSLLLEELYGATYSNIAKTSTKKGLTDMIRSHPKEHEKIVEGMGEVIQFQIEKGIVQHSILHKLTQQYFSNGTPAQKTDMANHLSEVVIEMLHSRAGALVGLSTVAYGTPKDRKKLVKSMKGYVSKISTEPDGHMVMMSLWDLVDDTVLLKESVLKEMQKCLEDLLTDRCGQRVLLYLMAPDVARYYPADVISCLKADIPEGAAKKDPAKRRAELLPHLVPQLEEFCTEHPELVLVPGGGDVLFELSAQLSDPSGLMGAVAGHLAGLKWSEIEEGEGGGRAGYDAVKRLMSSQSSEGESSGLVEALAAALKGSSVEYAVDGGGFLVAALLQHKEAKKVLEAELKKGQAKLKKADEASGCAVLLKALNK